MAEASDGAVLGRFDGKPVRIGRFTHAFFKRNGKFFVRTDGADGKLADFEIAYTFGVYPLQQYLIALSGGRLQALTVAWDARPATTGGQRWFSLRPDSRSSNDELHWTRPAQNWNHLCADCHSTAVRKNYLADADSFHTSWSEISVGCEACHGPGSKHIAWAAHPDRDRTMGLTARLDERRDVTWMNDASTGNATRSRRRDSDRELQVCAQCHSGRRQIADGYVAGKPFYDYYRPALLAPPLYHVDGQPRGEVYEWGSFLQSKMNARGVTCSDCHDPHSGDTRADGNALCAQCHSAKKFDTFVHDHHPAPRSRVTCVACHMPTTTYMRVDARHDHSFRVPRPDLSVTVGTPNACASCHADRGAAWAAERIAGWRGDTIVKGFQRYASAFSAAERRMPEAQQRLIDVARDSTQPAIARATALARLTALNDRPTVGMLSQGVNDPNPLVRLGALQGSAGLSLEGRAALVAPLLSDPVAAVRVDAVRLRAGAPYVSSEQQSAVERAVSEYVAVQQYNADRADARTNLGTFFAELGNLSRAEAELREAIRLDPFFSPAYISLADIFRADSSHDADTEKLLRDGIARAPTDPALHHSLGLALIRLQRLDDARSELQRAVSLDPRNVRFGYVYAVALHAVGRNREAVAELERLLALAPNDTDVRAALLLYRR